MFYPSVGFFRYNALIPFTVNVDFSDAVGPGWARKEGGEGVDVYLRVPQAVCLCVWGVGAVHCGMEWFEKECVGMCWDIMPCEPHTPLAVH